MGNGSKILRKCHIAGDNKLKKELKGNQED
jgi:hypothetical protein